mmetsp:Transcript_48783/g.86861  ORF Transcript_48783/g.86861 Transcript_48783/m.86861 type:complete len:234 (-) Transcript_48783:374-1075(-)
MNHWPSFLIASFLTFLRSSPSLPLPRVLFLLRVVLLPPFGALPHPCAADIQQLAAVSLLAVAPPPPVFARPPFLALPPLPFASSPALALPPPLAYVAPLDVSSLVGLLLPFSVSFPPFFDPQVFLAQFVLRRVFANVLAQAAPSFLLLPSLALLPVHVLLFLFLPSLPFLSLFVFQFLEVHVRPPLFDVPFLLLVVVVGVVVSMEERQHKVRLEADVVHRCESCYPLAIGHRC